VTRIASARGGGCIWSKHRSTLKKQVHSTLIAFGYQRPVSDLFGIAGRQLLRELDIPARWRGHIDASVKLSDELDLRIAAIEHGLRARALIAATSRSR
jgi:hypothetical protein